jgi:DNA topoisomerase VI subunit A
MSTEQDMKQATAELHAQLRGRVSTIERLLADSTLRDLYYMRKHCREYASDLANSSDRRATHRLIARLLTKQIDRY